MSATMPTKTRYIQSRIDRYGPSWDISNALFNTVLSEQIDYSNNAKRTARGNFIGVNTCVHRKCHEPVDVYNSNGNRSRILRLSLVNGIPWDAIDFRAQSYVYVELDFQKNNSFEILPFLLEWDETLKMFSQSMMKTLSYGSLTWGVTPFFSDLISLANTLKDLQDGMLTAYEKVIGKRISRRNPFSGNIPGRAGNEDVTYSYEGAVTVQGFLDGQLAYPDDPLRAMLAFMDEIGVNPDLKTAWDILPFSFVVDYFLPIGDLLESLHPRGWFKPTFTLNGTISYKYTVTATARTGTVTPGKHTGYYRFSAANQSIGTRPPVDPKYESPSFRELFNTAFLAASNRK
jgi:hypothetical protein